MIASGIQFAMLTYAFTINAPLITMSIASYLYAIALSRIVKGSLFAINRSSNRAEKLDRSILLEQIIEFLEVHSSAKQLSGKLIYPDMKKITLFAFITDIHPYLD